MPLRRALAPLAVPILVLAGCSNDEGSDDTTVPTAAVSPARSSTTGPAATTTAPTPTTPADLSQLTVRLTEVAAVESPTYRRTGGASLAFM